MNLCQRHWKVPNKLISVYIIFLLITAGFAGLLIFEGMVDEGDVSAVAPLFAGGDGSKGNPYQISNVTELQWMGNTSNLDKHFILVNDIDASGTKTWNGGAGFEPVGGMSNRFTGSLDGQRYNITDLFINRGSTGIVGLFGFIGWGGMVINVSLMDNNISGGWTIGGLVGFNDYGTVTNSYATGDVSGDGGVGGLVGENHEGDVNNCYATGNVSGTGDYVGGLMGSNHGTVSNSYATGDISGTGDYVGGLVGYNFYGTVNNSYATGDVSGTGDYIGGLVGFNDWTGTVKKCYATGSVSGDDSVGGLVGYNDEYDMDNGWIENCYATGNVNGDDNIGALVGYNRGTVENCYATANVSGDDKVGGLVGWNDYGTVSDSYCAGAVTGNTNIGGFCGDRVWGSILDCFFDNQTSGMTTSYGGTGKNTSEMNTKSTFTGVGWDFIDTWRIIENYSYPFFQNFNYSLSIDDSNNEDAYEDELYITDYDIETDLPGVNDIPGIWGFDTNASFLSINATGVLNGTPRNDDVGIYFINITVEILEIDLSKHTNFILTVHNTNDVPYITSPPLITATEDVLYNYSVSAGDDDLNISVGENLTFSLDSAPAGISINSSTGLIQWVPTNEQACQNYTVIVNVTDTAETFDTQEFIVNVTNTNDDPVIISTAVTTAVEDEMFEYQVTATDDDLLNPSIEQLTFSLDNAPEGMTVDPDSGLIQWLPTNDDVGTNWVNITVSDLALASNSQNFTLTVINVNDPPMITSEPILEATALVLYKYQLNVTDVDKGDVLTFTFETYPDNMVIDETSGLITWIPYPEQIGDNPVIVRVSDANESDTQEFNIKVTAPANYAHRVTLILPANTSIVNVTNPMLTWSSNDPDSEMITYDVYLHSDQSKVRRLDIVSQLDTGQTKDSYQTSDLPKGSVYYWTVIPDDGEATGKCSSGIWWFKVSETATFNYAPVITSEPIKSAAIGEQYRYEVLAEDDNQDDVLEYSLVEHPKNMLIDADSGVILWTPSEDQLGKHMIIVKVSDGKSFVLQTYEIEVTLRNNKPEVTEIPEQIIMVGEKFSYQVMANDIDILDILTYHLENAPTGMVINSTGTITWVPNKDQVGKHTITLNVSDGKDYVLLEFTVNAKKEDTTTTSGLDATTLGIIVIVIILIILLLAFALILTKRKKAKKSKLGSLSISEQEVLQPSMMTQPGGQQTPSTTAVQLSTSATTQDVPQPSQTTITAVESMVPVQATSQLGAAQLPQETNNQLSQVQPAPQLPPVTSTKPATIPQAEMSPETVVPPTEAPPIQESPEPPPTAELPPDAYMQPQVQPLVQEQPSTQLPASSNLTPDQATTQPLIPTPTHPQTQPQQPTQPLTTPCPLCNQQIPEYTNPCPHCGGALEWGGNS